MNLIQRVQQIGRNFKQGFRTADVLQRRDYAETKQQGGYYGESLLDPKFKRSLAGRSSSTMISFILSIFQKVNASI